ncbi:uncharacterized protein DNG_02379 [Cephalotrichum gorgonifer]|uniref:Uncharacterized protein n=1 Tax=Cephalotrichum gorgonifer TaxID=2041049 RepID=A0AAE8MSB5_9PEZI|nr:uncharacterized protein DNG_02379 [Cephalotrichum gorgonifer]
MDPPEQLLDAFRAAALSVTKLYKTSASAQAKSRQEGYQECIDDLLAFLDREDLGLGDGEGWQIRRWATERRAGSSDAMVQDKESEDEVDKEACSDPEKGSHHGPAADRTEAAHGDGTASGNDVATGTDVGPGASGNANTTVPTQEHFTFHSGIAYPDAPSLATLNLSDSAYTPAQTQSSQHTPGSGSSASAPNGGSARARRVARPVARTGAALGRGAGQKRRINFAEIFDLGSLGGGKDMFGGGKRTRHL